MACYFYRQNTYLLSASNCRITNLRPAQADCGFFSPFFLPLSGALCKACSTDTLTLAQKRPLPSLTHSVWGKGASFKGIPPTRNAWKNPLSSSPQMAPIFFPMLTLYCKAYIANIWMKVKRFRIYSCIYFFIFRISITI